MATPPYRAYAAITGTFAGGLAAAGLLERALGRDPREQSWLDLATPAAATFKASRTIARDEGTSFLREPSTPEQAPEGSEGPGQTGDRRQAIGGRGTGGRSPGTWGR